LLYVTKPYLQKALRTDLTQFDVEIRHTANSPLFRAITRVMGHSPRKDRFELLYWGIILGLIGFVALTLQQISLLYISATKAAFITSLYVIMTPIAEHFFLDRQHALKWTTWLAAGLSVVGTYYLTGCADTNIFVALGLGDFIVFCSMLLLTVELLLSDMAAKSCDCIELTCLQFFVISIFSILIAVVYEPQYWTAFPPLQGLDVHGGWDMIALVSFTEGFGMLFSTLGQMTVPASRAALIYGFEGVTTAVFAYFLLSERLSHSELFGCITVFFAILLTIDFSDNSIEGIHTSNPTDLAILGSPGDSTLARMRGASHESVSSTSSRCAVHYRPIALKQPAALNSSDDVMCTMKEIDSLENACSQSAPLHSSLAAAAETFGLLNDNNSSRAIDASYGSIP
jgi:drug/metabolite transporter (DMT)-like permease